MGLSDSTLKALSEPCTKSCHDCSKYCLDDFEINSNCSKCCACHIKTNKHSEESESEEQDTTS